MLTATAVLARNSLEYVAHILGNENGLLVGVQDLSAARALPGIAVDRCIETAVTHGWYSRRHALTSTDEPALLVYTSGTEGVPKGILLSRANLANTAQRIIDRMQMTAEIREYVGVPVSYSFGMGRFRAICAVGGAAYLPPRGFDPLEIARMLRAGEINALSAVPTLLRVLLSAPEIIGDAGANLRWMEIGSQYMSAEEKRGIRRLFPNARIVQHYGLTEASRSTFLEVSGVEDRWLESVGTASGGVEIGISPEGTIRIRGPHVARWRVDAAGQHPLCDAEGWLQTNDLGHLDGGFLFFDGRADDLINSGGVKIVPDILEQRIRARLGSGDRIAVARIADPARGDGVLAVIEGSESGVPRLKEAALAALAELGADAAGSLRVAPVQAIPLTPTGKPRRRELAQEFAQRLKVESAAIPAPATAGKDVASVFRLIFPGVPVRATDSFESLGGDSLRYIQFSMQFERRFGPLPEHWERQTVQQLQSAAVAPRRMTRRMMIARLDTATMCRAIAMILIVARHSNAFIYSPRSGAGFLLVVLGGYALARFQLSEILRTGSVRNVLGTALRIAIPTLLMVAPSQVMTHTFEPLQYLLVSNFLDPTDPVRSNWVAFYFAEIFIQLLLLAALVFSFARVRELFKARPLVGALLLFLVAAGLNALIEHFWDTDYLFNRTPHSWAWMFAFGIAMGVANTTSQRAMLLLLAIVSFSLADYGMTGAMVVMILGIGLVLFVPTLPLPTYVKQLVSEIASASMFIYLVHYEVIPIVEKLVGGSAVAGWLALGASIVAGVVAARVYGILERWVVDKWAGRTPRGAPA